MDTTNAETSVAVFLQLLHCEVFFPPPFDYWSYACVGELLPLQLAKSASLFFSDGHK